MRRASLGTKKICFVSPLWDLEARRYRVLAPLQGWRSHPAHRLGRPVIGYGSKEAKKTPPFIVGSSVGTSVEIKEIFFNTPARRKFLKSPATELSHICDAVNRMALAHPEVHFRLSHDGRMIADYVAVSERMDRLHQVLGREIAKDLIPFSSARGRLAISGYLSSAPASFPNTRYLMTFVNRRFVRDKVVTHAVLHGYETLLMKGQYPAAIVFLEVPCADVDVNVHPAKYEVRFRRPSDVHDAVADAIRQALRQEAKGPPARAPAIESRPRPLPASWKRRSRIWVRRSHKTSDT